MDAFWCITLTILLIRFVWRHKIIRRPARLRRIEPVLVAPVSGEITSENLEEERKNAEQEKQRQRDIADLKRQGYTDEIIATILPVISNDK